MDMGNEKEDRRELLIAVSLYNLTLVLSKCNECMIPSMIYILVFLNSMVFNWGRGANDDKAFRDTYLNP